MPDDNAPQPLGAYIDIKHGYAFEGRYFTDEPTTNILVTPGNFAIGGGFQLGKEKFYNGPVPEDYVLREGDLIVTMTDLSKAGDTLGYPARVPLTAGRTYLHNQRIGLVSITESDHLDRDFLYYLLCTDAYRHHVLATATGSTVRHTSPGRIRDFVVLLPTLLEQRGAAEVLRSLDDKIEQNRRTGRKLEGLARAVFKAWFVDFEPVKAKAAGATAFPGMPAATFAALPTRLVDSPLGPVPEGWESCWHRVCKLEQDETLLIGDGYRAKRSELADTGAPFIRAGNVNGSIITDGAELLGHPAVAKAGVKRSQVWDTVFTSKGTVGRIGLVTPSTGDVVYAPQVCFWRALDHDRLSPFLLHLWMKSESFTCQWMSVKGQTDMADFVSLSDQRAMTMLVPPRDVQRGSTGSCARWWN